jgi:multiple sugar transport system permease protein
VLVVFPTVFLHYASGFDWNFVLNIQKFIGLDNYYNLVRDDNFLSALRLTATITCVALACEFLVGFGLALAMNSIRFKGKSFITTFIIAPMCLAPIVVGFTWRLAFGAQWGYVNHFLSIISGQDVFINWLSDPFPATLMIISADIWQWMPFVFISLYSGLSMLPREPFEMAELDGASSWQRVRYLTFPLLKGVITATLLLRALDAAKVFDYIFITTAGGPGYATESLSLFIYKVVFSYTSLGYSSAAAAIFLWAVAVFVLLLVRFLGEQLTGSKKQ